MINKKKLCTTIIFMLFLVSSIFAWLEDDKKEILSEFNYIEEDAAQPILRALYKKGLELYYINNFKEAEFYFRKIIDINKNYRQTEFLAEAINKMQKYPIYEAKSIVIADYYEEGILHYEKAHYLKSLHIWEKLLVLNPIQSDLIKSSISDARHLLAEPHYVKGWEYYRKNKFDKAIEEWEEVLALVPTYHGLTSLLEKTKEKALFTKLNKTLSEARKFYNTNKLKDALKKVNHALSISDTYDPALKLKKNIEIKMDKLYYSYFNKGLELYRDSKYNKSIINFKSCLDFVFDKKRISEVKNYIRKAQHQIALLKRKKKKKKTIIKEPEPEPVLIKEIDEDEVRKHYNQGLYYYKNGYLDKAIAEWEIVLNLDPGHEKAYTNLRRAKEALKQR